jgi:hypothetical protein
MGDSKGSGEGGLTKSSDLLDKRHVRTGSRGYIAGVAVQFITGHRTNRLKCDIVHAGNWCVTSHTSRRLHQDSSHRHILLPYDAESDSSVFHGSR